MIDITSDCHFQTPCEGFEDTLYLMVLVLAFGLDVQVHLRSIRKALEEMQEHLRGHLADFLTCELRIPHQPGSAAEVESHATQTVVHRQTVDFMFVDMPPGTGDVPLTVFQSLPVDGIIVVSSPQQLVRVIVEKAVNMANMMNIPILGIVENMSYVKCPDCGKEITVFGKSNIDEIAKTFNIPVLARIPMEETTSRAVDAGDVDSLDISEISGATAAIEKLLK